MKINIVWDEVTWYSKALSIFFFLLIMPVVCFCIGKEFEQTMAIYDNLELLTSKTNQQSFGSIKSILIERHNFGSTENSSNNGIVE